MAEREASVNQEREDQLEQIAALERGETLTRSPTLASKAAAAGALPVSRAGSLQPVREGA
jgi:hypothetical protein